MNDLSTFDLHIIYCDTSAYDITFTMCKIFFSYEFRVIDISNEQDFGLLIKEKLYISTEFCLETHYLNQRYACLLSLCTCKHIPLFL